MKKPKKEKILPSISESKSGLFPRERPMKPEFVSKKDKK
jgi:hypothetical protein